MTVIDIDIPQKRISLSLKSDPFSKKGVKMTKPRENKSNEGGDLQSKLSMLKGKFGGS